jgi:hypothetical protein
MSDDPIPLETVTRAAKRWGVTGACVRLWIAQGLLPRDRVHRVNSQMNLLVVGPRPVTRPRGRPRKS